MAAAVDRGTLEPRAAIQLAAAVQSGRTTQFKALSFLASRTRHGDSEAASEDVEGWLRESAAPGGDGSEAPSSRRSRPGLAGRQISSTFSLHDAPSRMPSAAAADEDESASRASLPTRDDARRLMMTLRSLSDGDEVNSDASDDEAQREGASSSLADLLPRFPSSGATSASVTIDQEPINLLAVEALLGDLRSALEAQNKLEIERIVEVRQSKSTI